MLAVLAAAAVLPAPSAAALDRDGHPHRLRTRRSSGSSSSSRAAGSRTTKRRDGSEPLRRALGDRVTKPGIDTDAAPDSAYGVEARISSTPGGSSCTCARARYFKYLSYEERRSPTRLVVDLWKAKPPSADGVSDRAESSAPARLSEDRVVLGRSWERNCRGQGAPPLRAFVRARAPQPAGRTRAHGSGDLFGRKLGRDVLLLGRRARQPGTLEAVSFSAKDGAVDCIAQVRGRLARLARALPNALVDSDALRAEAGARPVRRSVLPALAAGARLVRAGKIALGVLFLVVLAVVVGIAFAGSATGSPPGSAWRVSTSAG